MPESLDPMVLRLLSYGLYVVTSKDNKKMNGQIVNTVFQVTADPPRIAVSINKKNYTHDLIQKSGIFSVSILDELTPMNFIGLFGFKSGRNVDKLEKVEHVISSKDCPMVTENSLGILEVKVIDQVDVGTHTVFIGDVVSGKVLQKGTPLTYAYYNLVKGGTAPKTAPTYISGVPKTAPTYIPPQEETSTQEETGPRYQCEVCGWVYDPTIGDVDHGVPPGTAFKELPDDWVCPLCGARKDQFKPI